MIENEHFVSEPEQQSTRKRDYSDGKIIRLQTICETELWAGFFGIDSNGTQSECGCVIEIEVESDCIEQDEDGIRPSFSVECPKCHRWLEWPQNWEIL